MIGIRGVGGSIRDARPKLGINGVKGVFGAEIYRPLHFEQREGLSVDKDVDRPPLGLPARRG